MKKGMISALYAAACIVLFHTPCAAASDTLSVKFEEGLIGRELARATGRVLARRDVHRRFENVEFGCTRRQFLYMMDNIPAFSYVIRRFSIDDITVESRTDGGFDGHDSYGVSGVFYRVQAPDGRVVFYGRGKYEKEPVRLSGEAVIMVKFMLPEEEARTVRCRIDCFILIKSAVLKTFLYALHPYVTELADRKITHVFNVGRRVMGRVRSDRDICVRYLEEAGYSPGYIGGFKDVMFR